MMIQSLILPHVCIFFDILEHLKRTLLFFCLALMGVGGNVLQAASKTVSKDKGNDPEAIIEVRREIFIH